MEDKKHSSAENNGDKALWDLLGKARKTEPGPLFARNVIRAVRLSEEAEPKGILAEIADWFKKPGVVVAVAAAVLVIGGLLIVQNGNPASPSPEIAAEFDAIEEIQLIDPAEEFNSIERLGELMAVSDPSELSDEALISLLF